MIVIWAHSLCRSTYRLFVELAKIEQVRLVSLEGVPELRRAQGVKEKEFAELDCEIIGENPARAREILAECRGATHLVAAYQVSPMMRQVVLEAKAQGGKAYVISEEPWNWLTGLKRLLWPIYRHTVMKYLVRKVVKVADGFINFSGDKKSRALELGWKNEKIHAFGYFPAALVEGEAKEKSLPLRVFVPATRGRWGRGEEQLSAALEGMDELKVEMSDFLEESELKREYARAHVVIAAGKDEPWGIRVNDAINAGCVVAVSEGMGCEKVVRETGCGIVFRGVKGLRAAMKEIARDYEKFARRIAAAQMAISPRTKAKELLEAIR